MQKQKNFLIGYKSSDILLTKSCESYYILTTSFKFTNFVEVV